MQEMIFISYAAGNFGPFKTTLSCEAPWVLTIGDSSIDISVKLLHNLEVKSNFQCWGQGQKEVKTKSLLDDVEHDTRTTSTTVGMFVKNDDGFISLFSLSTISGNMVNLPLSTKFSCKSFLISTSHFMMEW